SSDLSNHVLGLQAAYANLHTDQERDYFMQRSHNVNRCGRSRHLARKLSLRRKRSSPNVFEMAATETITSIILIKLIRVSLGTVRSEERFSRNAETDLVCRLLLEKKKKRSRRKSTLK